MSKSKNKKLMKLQSTQDYLPIRDVRDGIVIMRDGRFVKIMEFAPVNFNLLSEDEQDSIVSTFHSALRTMPKSLQFKIVTKKADVSPFIDRLEADMAVEKNPRCVQMQKEQANLIASIGVVAGTTRHYYVIFEYEQPIGMKKSPSFEEVSASLNMSAANVRSMLLLCGNRQVSKDKDDEWTLNALYNIVCRAQSDQVSFRSHMADVLAAYASNPGVSFGPDAILPVNDFIAPSYIDPGRSPKYIVVDDLYYAFLLVDGDSIPETVAAGWPQIFTTLGEGIDVDIWCHKEDPTAIMNKMMFKLRTNLSKQRNSEDTNQGYEDLSAAIDAGYYLKQGMAAGDDFCYFGLMLTVTAYSAQDLERRVLMVKEVAVRNCVKLRQCTFQMEDAFRMSLPVCKYNESLWSLAQRNTLISQFASAYPFTSFEMMDEEGLLLGVSEGNSSLIFVDPYKYANANMVFLGSSGSGKTYALQCIALRMREKGQQVFIIAPLKGHEYERACTAIGGQYVKISAGSDHHINIMEIRKRDDVFSLDGEDTASESILLAKIQQLHIFFSLLLPDIKYEEKQTLDEALLRTYENFGITTKNKSLLDPGNPGRYRPMPVLGDLHKVLKGMGSPASRLYHNLTRYVTGSASSFNHPTNVNLNNQYVVLDVSSLTDELMPMGMFICLDYVLDKAKENRASHKAIIIDEVWHLVGPFASQEAAKFVITIFKTIRAYGGSAIAATQDLEDISGGFGETIINNSRLQFVLKMERKEARSIGASMELTSNELERISKMQRGTCLLIANETRVFINIIASKTEHDLITTDPADLQRIANEQKRRKQQKS